MARNGLERDRPRLLGLRCGPRCLSLSETLLEWIHAIADEPVQWGRSVAGFGQRYRVGAAGPTQAHLAHLPPASLYLTSQKAVPLSRTSK